MVYYRVKKQFDGMRTPSGKVLVRNELLTEKEVVNMNIQSRCLTKVEVSKRNIYISFGVRFETGTDHNSNL